MVMHDYLCYCKSEISNVCNALEGHCMEAMKIMHHHANGRFDWLISEHRIVTPSREAISIQSIAEHVNVRDTKSVISP